jgi:glycine cleavage system H protein
MPSRTLATSAISYSRRRASASRPAVISVPGEVVDVNVAAVKDPGMLNEDPFGKGWLLRVRASGTPKGLLDAKTYIKFVRLLET